MALNAQTALVFQALATGPEGEMTEMATYGHRAILLRSSIPERRLLRDDWRWSRETWALVVRDAAEELLRTAPGRLTVPELAFTLLGTMHRLADPTGIRWGRMLEGLEGLG